MNKLNALNAEAQQEIICGRTEVSVFKRVQDEGGLEKIKVIHKGVVVQTTVGNKFVRVFNPAAVGNGGDTAQEHAEWFPLDSRPLWCEVTGQRDENSALAISPLLK